MSPKGLRSVIIPGVFFCPRRGLLIPPGLCEDPTHDNQRGDHVPVIQVSSWHGPPTTKTSLKQSHNSLSWVLKGLSQARPCWWGRRMWASLSGSRQLLVPTNKPKDCQLSFCLPRVPLLTPHHCQQLWGPDYEAVTCWVWPLLSWQKPTVCERDIHIWTPILPSFGRLDSTCKIANVFSDPRKSLQLKPCLLRQCSHPLSLWLHEV